MQPGIFQPLEMTDAELVDRAHTGELEAVGHLYDRHQEKIYRYVRSRVSESELAHDLTGEVFIRMVAALPDYRSTIAPFSAWLYRIARNLITDHHRKEGKYMSVPIKYADQVRENQQSPAEKVEQQITMETVRMALETLDEAQQDVIRLRFLVGLPIKEVAESLDLTVASVKAHQHRGLLALRVALGQDLQEQST